MVLAQSLKLPVKEEKTVLPSTKVELHGITVDTIAMELSLPPDKLSRALNQIRSMVSCKKVELVELQSLIGLLNFACRAVVPGRAFLRRLIDLTKGAHRRHHHVRLTREARRDLSAWREFLENFNGRVMCLPTLWTSSDTLKLFSDASGFACAAIFGRDWLQVEFPSSWQSTNIAIKELLPIVLAVRLWAERLKNKRILFFTDNEAIVFVINNTTSKVPDMMHLVRQLVSTCLINNVQFAAKHIPGRHNLLPDLLSRLQVPKAQVTAPWLAKLPSAVPDEWLPWSP